MTMDTGLYRTELAGLAGLARVSGVGVGDSAQSEKPAAKYITSGFAWLPAVVIAGVGAWLLLSGYTSNVAGSESVSLATAATTEPAPPAPVTTVAHDGSLFDPATAEAITPAQRAPVDGLKISSQSWRRGGLGSNALVTFTLRNANEYAVKDIELFCSFTRRDGSHLTDRKRVIPDIVNTKSRRTFARVHIGFVNVNADRAKCSPVAASHI